MAVIVSKGIVVPSYAPPVGTTWLFEESGTFEVPADGKYQIEMHGGGGGAAYHFYAYGYTVGGGGSGELIELELTKGDAWPVTIGAGSASRKVTGGSSTIIASQGGTTTFGSYSVAGGGGAQANDYSSVGYVGSASGSIASAGKGGGTGGEGNVNNTAQTYGDGGAIVNGNPVNGKHGAVIITYLGVA